MSTTRIIGGTPRTGKTTFYRTNNWDNGDRVDLDHLRWTMAPFLGLSESLEFPEVFMRLPVEDWMLKMDEREDQIWALAERYVKASKFAGNPVTLCGNIRPRHLDNLIQIDPSIKSVFWVDTKIEDRIFKIVSFSERNWQKGWNREELLRWTELTKIRALNVVKEAEERGFPVVDIATGGYELATENSDSYLK